MGTATRRDFVSDLRALGVRDGMTLLVHASARRSGPVEGGPPAMIEALLECLGPSGNLMMPTHSWDTVNARQPVFHVRRTPSSVGYLTELFRRREDAVRSLHPCHSVATVGPRAEYLTSGQLDVRTPCPPASPYGRTMREEGFILFLGVDLAVNTSFHALEEEAGVAGLLTEKPEPLCVIDGQDRLHESPQFRHAQGFMRHYVDLESILEEAGAIRFRRIGQGLSRLVDAVAMRRVVLPILRETPEFVIHPRR